MCADQIQANDGGMYGNGIPAWHGKGVVIEGLATAAECLAHAGLDWLVEKEPIQLMTNGVELDDLVATVRADDKTVLGYVGPRYQALQNVDIFSIFDPVCDRGEAVYETAGSLFGGKKVYVTAKIPDLIRVGTGDDVIQPYLLATTAHDGSCSTIVKPIHTRVVCNNTLAMALREKGQDFKIRHTANAKDRLDDAILAMGIMKKKNKEQEELYNAMASKVMDTAEVKAFLERCLKVKTAKNEIDDIQEALAEEKKKKDSYLLLKAGELYETSNVLTRGNLWGAFNAVTEAVNHHRRSRESAKTDTEDNRLNSLLYGASAATMSLAMAEATKLVRV